MVLYHYQTRHHVIKSFNSGVVSVFQHPNIPTSILSTANESGGIVIRPSYEKGTLRDLICKCRPRGHYLKKYASPSKTVSLDLQSIKLFGKQILGTLNLLHEKGLPYCKYFLHCNFPG